MKSFLRKRTPLSALLVLAALAGAADAADAADAIRDADTATIEQITGMKGKLGKDENVFKITKPRTDIKVTVDRMPLPPFMGLAPWAGFTPAHDGQLMMMGDMVVFEDEVNPAMSAALGAGLQVTALHNHFFFDQPKVYFMHIGGMGTAEELATGIRKVQDTIAEIRKAHPQPVQQFDGTAPSSSSSISAAPLESIFGQKGEVNNGMFKVTIGRPTAIHGMKVGKEMGVNTWAGFAGTDDQAVVDGDFAVLPKELQPVLKSMRASNINIVSIHQHLIDEEPRLLFLHYWGKGKAKDLATGVKKALDAQATTH